MTPKHIVLTSHPEPGASPPPPINWGADRAIDRGPLIATRSAVADKNVIGTYSGSYMVYRALAIASGSLKADHRPDLTLTNPAVNIGPHPSWFKPKQIVSLDPFGALAQGEFEDWRADGADIRPTIAITKAHIEIPELNQVIQSGELVPDGKILKEGGTVTVTKAAIEPVWYLPGIAERFEIEESELRRCLFEHTGGMYPELVTRPDIKVFLPPIGGLTVYIMGDAEKLGDSSIDVSCRVHDECNGSDVFGSDICTCRPYLVHGIEVCIDQAQRGGIGVIVYNRKEGRALGEVTKFLVYNARKRQEGGDTAAQYFARTECVAGVQDMRFQELMPDSLHWLGIDRIHRFVSMSDMKYNAIVGSGIKVEQRLSIPADRIPPDAHVEMDAKKAAGYFTQETSPSNAELNIAKGRKLHE